EWSWRAPRSGGPELGGPWNDRPYCHKVVLTSRSPLMRSEAARIPRNKGKTDPGHRISNRQCFGRRRGKNNYHSWPTITSPVGKSRRFSCDPGSHPAVLLAGILSVGIQARGGTEFRKPGPGSSDRGWAGRAFLSENPACGESHPRDGPIDSRRGA